MPVGDPVGGVGGAGEPGLGGEEVAERGGQRPAKHALVGGGWLGLSVRVDAEDAAPLPGQLDHGVGVGIIHAVGMPPHVPAVE